MKRDLNTDARTTYIAAAFGEKALLVDGLAEDGSSSSVGSRQEISIVGSIQELLRITQLGMRRKQRSGADDYNAPGFGDGTGNLKQTS